MVAHYRVDSFYRISSTKQCIKRERERKEVGGERERRRGREGGKREREKNSMKIIRKTRIQSYYNILSKISNV